MVPIDSYKYKIILKSAFLCISVLIIFLILGHTDIYYALVLGFIISSLNFHLLSQDVSKINILAKKEYQSVLIIRYFFRYAMIALAMICVIKYDLGIVPFVLGFFSVQAVLIIDNIYSKRVSHNP